MSKDQVRPGHATLAGALIIGGSIIVVLSAWERISTLHTLEAQEELQRILADPPMSGTGLSADGLATLVRVLCLVGAGAAAASTILGFQVFKRSMSARLALTALSPLLLVGGMATAGFLAPMVVAGIALLWLQPTRDWYAGRPWVQRYEERRAARLAGLRPSDGPGQSVAGESSTPAPGTTLLGQASGQPHQPGVVRRIRPTALVAACALTWCASTLVVIGLGIIAVVLPSQSDELLAEITREQPKMVETYDFTEASLLGGMYVMLVGLALWAVAAMVLAALAFLGQNWARITLVVSAVCGGVLALVMAVGAWPLAILVAVFALSTWLLLRPEVGRWYQR